MSVHSSTTVKRSGERDNHYNSGMSCFKRSPFICLNKLHNYKPLESTTNVVIANTSFMGQHILTSQLSYSPYTGRHTRWRPGFCELCRCPNQKARARIGTRPPAGCMHVLHWMDGWRVQLNLSSRLLQDRHELFSSLKYPEQPVDPVCKIIRISEASVM